MFSQHKNTLSKVKNKNPRNGQLMKILTPKNLLYNTGAVRQ